MELKDYINKWDDRINVWFESPDDYSDLYLNALPNAFQKDYMPEPYFGNPNKCSFVIVNLNPGQGCCQSWYSMKNINSTMINAVSKSKKYSKIAMTFPYLKTVSETRFSNWDIYEACKWWNSKGPWLNHVYSCFNMIYSKEAVLPFAIELCAWHSAKWPSKFNTIYSKDNPLKEEIGNIVSVVCKAIDESQYKFAYSVGKLIGNILKEYGFCDVELPFIKTSDGYLIKEGTKRYYRLLCDKKGHFVINTWSIGSNNYPSKFFYDTDKLLFCEIKKEINNI